MGPTIDVAVPEHTAACKRCDEQISLEAAVCPACGYDPKSVGERRRQANSVLAWMLTVSVVGAVIGVPWLFLTEHQKRQARHRRPTTYSPP